MDEERRAANRAEFPAEAPLGLLGLTRSPSRSARAVGLLGCWSAGAVGLWRNAKWQRKCPGTSSASAGNIAQRTREAGSENSGAEIHPWSPVEPSYNPSKTQRFSPVDLRRALVKPSKTQQRWFRVGSALVRRWFRVGSLASSWSFTGGSRVVHWSFRVGSPALISTPVLAARH